MITDETQAAPLTAEEILAGKTQAGVSPPASFRPHDDDGSVHRVRGGSFFTPPDLGEERSVELSVEEAAGCVRAARDGFKSAQAAAAAAQVALDTAHGALRSAEADFNAAVSKAHGL